MEIGGTVGDIESLPFLEAIRQMRKDVGTDLLLQAVHAVIIGSHGSRARLVALPIGLHDRGEHTPAFLPQPLDATRKGRRGSGVHVQHDFGDRRSVIVRLTTAGKQAIDAAIQVRLDAADAGEELRSGDAAA